MKLIVALVMLLALSACSLPVFYRVPIVQGNIVTADQVAKLKKGMTKKQVAYVLGTPLINSPFEANRWDYLFYYRNPRAHVRESKLDLYFIDDKLSDINGNEEYAARSLKAGTQAGAGHPNPLPGASASTPAPLGQSNKGRIPPGNASDQIPHTQTTRPGGNQTRPGPGQPNTPARPIGQGRTGSHGAMPNRGPALPGHPG